MKHKYPGFLLVELLVALCCTMVLLSAWYQYLANLQARQAVVYQGYQAMGLMREYAEKIYATGHLEPSKKVGIFTLQSAVHIPSFALTDNASFKTIDLTISWENQGKKYTFTFVTGAHTRS